MSKISLQLKKEHEIIEQLLNCLLNVLDEITQKQLPENIVLQSMTFLQKYATEFHVAKEEILFKISKQQGIHTEIFSDCMVVEHYTFHYSLNQILDILPKAKESTDALEQLQVFLDELIFSIRRHIEKEESIVFPLAEETLSEASKIEVLHIFQNLNEQFATSNEQQLSVLKSLLKRYQISAPELSF